MFFLNLGRSDLNLVGIVGGTHGVIFLPSSNYSERVSREALNQQPIVLFDPQLYLATLDRTNCTKVCGRLSSYPWFNVPDTPNCGDYDGLNKWHSALTEHAKTNWPGRPPEGDDILTACIESLRFQEGLGCGQIILPTPLIADPSGEGGILATWLDEAQRAIRDEEAEGTFLATVALDESAITENFFERHALLDAVVDQVTARSLINGVYIVVSQSTPRHPLKAPICVYKAYIALSKAFADVGMQQIIVNFADIFGIACVGIGATAFGTGWSQTRRRLSPASMADRAWGRVYPHFYSHSVIREFLPKTQLDSIASSGALWIVEDVSPFSERLMETLGSGGSANDLISWEESNNNVSTSKAHFIYRLAEVGRELSALRGRESRLSQVHAWIENAWMRNDFLQQRLGVDSSYGEGANAKEWLGLIDSV